MQHFSITDILIKRKCSRLPDFRWDEKIHSLSETFLILFEDADGEIILFSDTFILRQRYAEDEHNVTITVPMFEPVPRIIIFLSFPKGCYTAKPSILYFPRDSRSRHNKEFEALYADSIRTFNKVQTQVFQALYTSDDNVFIGAPTGSGKTICAEFALLRLWSKLDPPCAICIGPYQEIVELPAAVSEEPSRFWLLSATSPRR